MDAKRIPPSAPCPFCGESKDLNIGRGAEEPEGFITWVYCGKCNAQGPWFHTRNSIHWTWTDVAAEASGWNKRSIPEAPKDGDCKTGIAIATEMADAMSLEIALYREAVADPDDYDALRRIVARWDDWYLRWRKANAIGADNV